MPVKLFLSPAILCSREQLPFMSPSLTQHPFSPRMYSWGPPTLKHRCPFRICIVECYLCWKLSIFPAFCSLCVIVCVCFFFIRIEGLEGWVSGWEGRVFVRQSEVTCVLHVNYEKHVPVVRLTTEEMDLVSQTVKSSFYTHFEK